MLSFRSHLCSPPHKMWRQHTALTLQERNDKSSTTKISLLYALLGLIVSIAFVAFLGAIPSIRIFSNEAASFGAMAAFVHLVTKSVASSSEQLDTNDEQSNANQQSKCTA
ncbi:hypothetical protein [Congregibacter litoralis]|uniref:Uncharacterized protein n=1 Tax=Congregibacter litoralis KT71 TaxID=314285 RepID=V7HS15_9GAMM|nr:hypothetical protein [Congregibacter litoralis]ESZ89358.1 hypothetical protein KT71_003338 [Congregibacter litoralis KT71]